jgi:uncharacterized protein
MRVFLDPDAITIVDDDHSGDEERWVTLGEATGSRLLLVIHTHVEITDDVVAVLIILARPPDAERSEPVSARI